MGTTLQLAQLVIAVLVLLILLGFTLRNRREPLAPWFAATLACMLLWSAGSIMEVVSSDADAQLFWLSVQFFGFVPMAPCWLMTMRVVVGERPLSRTALVVLWAPCALILGLVVANPLGIHYSAATVNGPVDIHHLGPLYTAVAFPYVALTLVAAVIVLIRRTRDARGAQYRRAIALAAATVLPLSLALLHTFGHGPWMKMDPSMSAITLAAAICGVVFWHYRLLGLAPLAYDAVVEHLADGVIVLNEDGKIVDANPSARAILPSLAHRASGQTLGSVLASHPQAATTIERLALQHPGGATADSIVSIEGQGGRDRHYSVAITNVRGRYGRRLGFVVVLHDVTRSIDLLTRTTRLAEEDDLTGLLTRRRFLELADEQMAAAGRKGSPVAVMLLDLDGFKSVNDLHGHAAGDQLLREVASACRRHLRPGDLAGRYGGDEICVLMPGAAREDGLLAAMRLREAISDLCVWHKGLQLAVTISVGVAGANVTPGMSIGSMLEEADGMLYAAKRGGRDRVAADIG